MKADQLVRLMQGIVELVSPAGTPAGTLYAVLMGQGCTLAQYEQIEAAMIAAGVVKKQGNVLYRV